MDFHGNYQPESGKLEQIVSQFLLKSLHIILDSRIPSFHPHDRSGELLSASRVRKSDKWFNLVLGDRPAALENLNFWHRNPMDPMIIDIILVHQGSTSSSVDNLYASSDGGTSAETVIERWVIQYESLRAMAPQPGEISASYKKTYKKAIMLLRSLYSQMRLLPAYRIFRQLKSSSHTYNFNIIYKVSSFCEPFSRTEEAIMKEYSFMPVEALPGRLCVSVTYRSMLSDFNLEPLSTMAPKIISDYVGSPTTDPMRSFPSSEKGVRGAFYPLREQHPPLSSPFQRPHSWSSGGFHKGAPFLHNQQLGGSPPLHRITSVPNDFPSSVPDNYGRKVQNYRRSATQKVSYYDDYQLSPPYSPSPSTPSYLSNGSPVQTSTSSETAPVTIPLPVMGRSSRYLSPNFSDSSKHSLPPLSPRSTKHDTSSQESPSGIRIIKKSDSLRSGDSNLGIGNHYSGHKLFKDGKEDSGRFSALLSSSGSPRIGFSRSSSRLSLQDDLDDCDFSCPFDVDDVDTSNSHASPNPDGNRNLESIPHSISMGKTSQDAAVGVLVHMLRTAPPLRQDSSCYSSHSQRTDSEEGVATASGFFMPRKTADALEELRSYREMKNLLLSKSGTRVIIKEEKT